jgi:hypothetical protein
LPKAGQTFILASDRRWNGTSPREIAFTATPHEKDSIHLR